jgi:PPOX class probable F420-dependent enzyme
MAGEIPQQYLDLFERPVVVGLVTLMPSGQPQATPVWCSYDGTHVLVNTARGRQKDFNMQRDEKVTVLAIDPENPYRWMEVRGKVAEISEDGAVDHINALAKKYRGDDDYYARDPDLRSKETRVIYRITPVKVNARG